MLLLLHLQLLMKANEKDRPKKLYAEETDVVEGKKNQYYNQQSS